MVINRPGQSALTSHRPTAGKANWARLSQKIYEVGPLKCANCGGSLHSIAAIDDADVIERILKHLGVWNPQPESCSPAGLDPPWPEGQTIPLGYNEVPPPI